MIGMLQEEKRRKMKDTFKTTGSRSMIDFIYSKTPGEHS